MVFLKCNSCGQVWDDTKPLKVVLHGICPGPLEILGAGPHKGPFSSVGRMNINYSPERASTKRQLFSMFSDSDVTAGELLENGHVAVFYARGTQTRTTHRGRSNSHLQSIA